MHWFDLSNGKMCRESPKCNTDFMLTLFAISKDWAIDRCCDRQINSEKKNQSNDFLNTAAAASSRLKLSKSYVSNAKNKSKKKNETNGNTKKNCMHIKILISFVNVIITLISSIESKLHFKCKHYSQNLRKDQRQMRKSDGSFFFSLFCNWHFVWFVIIVCKI